MRDLTGVAEQLRNVREAEKRFLRIWAMEQSVIVPGLDRVAADIDSAAMGDFFVQDPGVPGNDSGLALGE